MKSAHLKYMPLVALFGLLAVIMSCGSDTASPPVADISSCHLFADAKTGDDSGDGSADSPYLSLTKALSVATLGNVVCAMQGTYSAPEETFPIFVTNGVLLTSVMGSKNTTITGGGDYGIVNAALVLNSGSAVNGFTILVPSSPDTSVIHVGIYTDDYTNSNERTLIINNVIRDIGFGHIGGAGIVVMQNASPSIEGNEIFGNHDGIALFNSACPTIRGNTIRDNEDNGIYMANSTAADMGARNDPGGNIITGNGLRGVYNFSLNGNIMASGNFWEINCSTADGTYPAEGLPIYGPGTDDNALCPSDPSNYRIEFAGASIMF